ncbi:MAG: 8-oxo-dGTP diphosphatase [Patescibacteria group bacterium]|nr:8-oxo-dGTP diphosphatase [Patescibacteria group bacterium]
MPLPSRFGTVCADMQTLIKKGVDTIGVAIVFFCHDGQGRVLMAKRSEKARDERGTWDIGGGALEFGETAEQTVRREIAEEYGATVLACEFLGYRDVHRVQNGVATHWIALDFRARIDPATVREGEPDVIQQVQWFTRDTLPSPLHSQLPRVLATHGDKLWIAEALA